MMGDASIILAEKKADSLYLENAAQYYIKAINLCKENNQLEFIESINDKIEEAKKK